MRIPCHQRGRRVALLRFVIDGAACLAARYWLLLRARDQQAAPPSILRGPVSQRYGRHKAASASLLFSTWDLLP
jgi:hypothetical protein